MSTGPPSDELDEPDPSSVGPPPFGVAVVTDPSGPVVTSVTDPSPFGVAVVTDPSGLVIVVDPSGFSELTDPSGLAADGALLATGADAAPCTAELVLVAGSTLVPGTPFAAGAEAPPGTVEAGPAFVPGIAPVVEVCVFALAVPPLLRPVFALWSVPLPVVCVKLLTMLAAALAAPAALAGELETPPWACVAVLTMLTGLFAAWAETPVATCCAASDDGWVTPVRPGPLPVPSRDAELA